VQVQHEQSPPPPPQHVACPRTRAAAADDDGNARSCGALHHHLSVPVRRANTMCPTRRLDVADGHLNDMTTDSRVNRKTLRALRGMRLEWYQQVAEHIGSRRFANGPVEVGASLDEVNEMLETHRERLQVPYIRGGCAPTSPSPTQHAVHPSVAHAHHPLRPRTRSDGACAWTQPRVGRSHPARVHAHRPGLFYDLGLDDALAARAHIGAGAACAAGLLL
jgi:hypothetical protein